MSDQNIYQMYVANNNRAGFYVRRDSWTTVIAKVISVGGQTEGPLPGEAPYFKNPKVRMDVFFNDGRLKARDEEMPCPGTYAYTLIEEPPHER